MFCSKVGCKGCGRKSGKGKLREVLGEVSLLDIGNRKKQKSTPLAPTHVFSLCQSCYLKIHRKKKENNARSRACKRLQFGHPVLVCLLYS